jgi:uncharacterized protein YaiI (UPF0178 family)
MVLSFDSSLWVVVVFGRVEGAEERGRMFTEARTLQERFMREVMDDSREKHHRQ